MELQKVALNFLVERGGKLVKSLLCTKPTKVINTNGLKYISNTNVHYGKHKIPRYTYHMTSKKNYESMVKDGFIKPSNSGLLGKGVFMTELTNFFKRWRNNKAWREKSLQEKLLSQVAKDENEIVMLKIPTDKLKHNKLKIRSQNILFKWATSKEGTNIFKEACRTAREGNSTAELRNWKATISNEYRKALKLIMGNDLKTFKHLTEGTLAKDSKLFKQKKHAIEYIYEDTIPISDVVKIGEVNLETLRTSRLYDPSKPIRSIFTALLQGQPEVKGAELLKC